MPHVWTIGHSNRSFAEVLAALRAHEITLLVDVRRFPGSRSFPQWRQEAIEEELPDDIGYLWLPELGGRRHTAAGTPSPNTGWRVKAFQDYADYMATDDFGSGLGRLQELAATQRPAIMCSEAVPWRCHRRLITDALLVDGIEVTHIMSPTSARSASLTEHAQVIDGRLVYPPG